MTILFGVSDCDKCNAIKTALSILDVHFDFMDANADENQQTADYYNVDALPHIVVTNDYGDRIAEYIGEKCWEFVTSKKNK